MGLMLLLATGRTDAEAQLRSCEVPPDHEQPTLAPGTLAKHHLRWTETHDHPIYLCQGEYLNAVVEQ